MYKLKQRQKGAGPLTETSYTVGVYTTYIQPHFVQLSFFGQFFLRLDRNIQTGLCLG